MRLFLFISALALCAAPLVGHAQVKLGGEDFSYAVPRTYEIGGITVTGDEHLDGNAIKLLSGLSVGQKIEVPGEKTAEALRSLWKRDLFSDIQLYATRIEGDKIFLEIKIEERARLSKFKFKGVNKSEADDLRERINLFKEKIVTENLLVSTENKIKEFFKEKGYFSCEVNVIQEVDSSFRNHVILTIDIDKGEKVKIENITFKGNRFFNKYQLIRSMKETKDKSIFRPFADLDTLGRNIGKNLFSNTAQVPYSMLHYFKDHVRIRIFKSSKFLKENYEEDKRSIVDKYNQKGYRDARIVFDTVRTLSPGRLEVEMHISEGRRYYFRNIKWIGNSKYPSEQLSSILGIKKGDVYNPSKLDARLRLDPNGSDVTSLYMDNGYLFFNLNEEELLVGRDSIDLLIRIYEGDQARINRIIVTGNTKTNDHVVLRELRTKPGQLFSRADIIRSQRELSVLGFFDPETMNIIPTPDPTTGTVDIEYQVEEKPNDQLQLQGGYGGGILIGTVGLTFNNFSTKNILKPKEWNGPLPSGDGQKLNLSFNTNGWQYQAFNTSFTEPWLGGKKPNSFTVGGSYQIINRNRKRIEQNGEKVLNENRSFFETTSLFASLGRRLKWPDDYFSMINEIGAQQYRLNNYGNFIFDTGKAYNFYYKLKIVRSSIDQTIFPTIGSEINFSAQFTPPFSLIGPEKDYSAPGITDDEKYRLLEYHKYKFTAAFYNKVINKFVLYTKVGFGALGLYNRQIGLAPFERFYLGGDPFSGNIGFNTLDSREIISLRGYAAQNLSPAVGATLISKYTAELRYPFSLNPNATIFGLAFTEAGNSWDDFDDFNPFNVYRSAGLGIRIFLPMFGLIGVDWGYRFDDVVNRPTFPRFDPQRSRFHFTLGMQLGEL